MFTIYCCSVEAGVLIRSIGKTMSSVNIRTLLRDICEQLCIILDTEHEEIPTVSVSTIFTLLPFITGAACYISN
jgi:hypothetical protein